MASRAQFCRSRLYRCALAFIERHQERLRNIRDILEAADLKEKRGGRRKNRGRYVSVWKIPDSGDRKMEKDCMTEEDKAVLSSNREEVEWVYVESSSDYALIVGGMTVMKVPTDMFQRLKPYQRDAVKWVAFVGPVGGILADAMGMGKTVRVKIGFRIRSQIHSQNSHSSPSSSS